MIKSVLWFSLGSAQNWETNKNTIYTNLRTSAIFCFSTLQCNKYKCVLLLYIVKTLIIYLTKLLLIKKKSKLLK